MRIVHVSPQALRRRFNAGRYHERAQSGEFCEVIEKNGHPSPPLAREPFCTRSQIIAYEDTQGNIVARVHQYLRPDNTIGLSGRPDPKRLFERGVLYVVTRPPRQQPRSQRRRPGRRR